MDKMDQNLNNDETLKEFINNPINFFDFANIKLNQN
jgi:hypothetical protein